MTTTTDTPPAAPAAPPRVTLRARLARAWDSDLAWSFRHSPVAIVATAMTVLLLAASLFAGFIAPQDAFDPAAINLLDAYTKPGDIGMGSNTVFWLGTDNQGRDLFSAILYGSRVSLFVGFLSVAFSVVMGVGLGLISGYVGAGRTRSSCASPTSSSLSPRSSSRSSSSAWPAASSRPRITSRWRSGC